MLNDTLYFFATANRTKRSGTKYPCCAAQFLYHKTKGNHDGMLSTKQNITISNTSSITIRNFLGY